MKYPYFRGLEADRYSFYRVPKALIKVDLFEKMSGDAKLLYAVLLDRMNLSLKNGWQDENGNAYIICTIDEIMDSIRCARQKAVKLLDELEHEYQLIERRRQGLGKPNLLYVKDLYNITDDSSKEFFTVKTKGGNTFFLVIDRARNSENVYMLSMIDEYDLQEFLTDEERNGKEEEKPAVVLPETKPEPEPDVEIEEPEQDDGKLTKILAIVFVMGVGGAGAFFYFYIYKPKQSEPEVSKENLEYEALPTKNEDEEAGQDAETEE